MKIEIDIDDDDVPDVIAEIDLKVVVRTVMIRLLPYVGVGGLLACGIMVG